MLKIKIKLDFNEIVIAHECVKLKGLRLLNTLIFLLSLVAAAAAVNFYFIATISPVQV